MENTKLFIQKNYPYAIYVILFSCIWFLYYKGEQVELQNIELDKQKIASEKLTKVYLNRNKALIPKLDSLSNKNSKLLEELKNKDEKNRNQKIIIKYYEKDKIVNKFWISDMQSYFYEQFGTVQND